jgi:hypothetical protein
LYLEGPLKCQSCHVSNDSNPHVSFCPSHSIQLSQILAEHKDILTNLLETHATTFTFDFRDRINNSKIFNLPPYLLTSGDSLLATHPAFLLVYNLIPTELMALFYNYIGCFSLRDKILLQFLKSIFKSINTIVWNAHQWDLKNWEKTLRITKNKKKFYQRLTTPTMTKQHYLLFYRIVV